MGLEKLSGQLLADAKKESDAIISGSQKQAEQVISFAQEKKRRIIFDAKKNAQEMAERERNEKISSANLEAKQLVDEQKSEVVEKALEEVFLQMKAIRRDKSYEKLLKSLISEGVSELGKESVVSVNEEDYSLAKKIFPGTLREAQKISGGAIVETRDKKIRVDNSFEALFEQKKDFAKKELFFELFPQKVKK